jgi:hypothetical protein
MHGLFDHLVGSLLEKSRSDAGRVSPGAEQRLVFTKHNRERERRVITLPILRPTLTHRTPIAMLEEVADYLWEMLP